ncbi:hypothetical protein PFICI_14324 [Pestalotiopsis fici W106-1]|uniref:Uncharacterized protein n=1 Tax=Pestalotiopsis fici (strain W106-1 / CGMCC3.15140) TaxID=1229662 RepID=W3WKP7_PESFW|nr:uncharacterized protein PFICI_14324 [Pestalotiopsis fici W106-1]ETS74458.1 hypothetical protein PFICI_14324 [Pestalotiopsis fici W106-1]
MSSGKAVAGPSSPTPLGKESRRQDATYERLDDEVEPTTAGSYDSYTTWSGPTAAQLAKRKRHEQQVEQREINRAMLPELYAGAPKTPADPEAHAAEARAALGIPTLAEYTAQADAKALEQRLASSDTAATLNGNKAVPEKKRGGLISSLSRDFSGTIGSMFSHTEPERRAIGKPFGFRRDDGAGPGLSGFFEEHRDSIEAYSQANAAAANINISAPDSTVEQNNANDTDEHNSSRGLVAPRPPTRRGNRTSLQVTIPNAISPIGEAHIPKKPVRNDSEEVIESFGTTTVIYATPPDTGDFANRNRNFGWPGSGGNRRNGGGNSGLVNLLQNLSPATITILFWILAILAQAAYTIVIVCVSILAYNSESEQQYDEGALRGLVASLIGILVFGPLFAVCYARRISNRTIKKHSNLRIETMVFRGRPDQFLYWLFVALAELSYTSTTAAVTIITVASHDGQDASNGTIIWLMLSVFAFALFGFPFAMMHARRTSTRIVRGHRSQQRHDDSIELQPVGTRNFSRPTNDPMQLAHELEAAVGRDNENLPTPATLPSIYSQSVLVTRSQNPNVRTPVAVYNDFSHDLDRTIAQNEDVDPSGISIAISDSLVGHCDESSPTPSISSGLTYHSGRSDLQKIDSPLEQVTPTPKSSSTPGSAPQLDSDYGSVLSAEQMSIISIPTAATKVHIPHSSAVADLSSSSDDRSMVSSPLRTPHTKASASPQIVSSSPFDFQGATSSVSAHHAAEFSIPRGGGMKRSISQASLGRRDEALGSHPIPDHWRQIDYDAGKIHSTQRRMSNEYMSGDPGPSSGPFSSATPHQRDTNYGFYAMTPIEERSESGTARSSMRTASYRISR